MENRSRPKRDRAHLHDMNIMERAGSPANSSYERTLPVERRAPGSLVTHRMCSGLSVGSLFTTVTGRSADFDCLSNDGRAVAKNYLRFIHSPLKETCAITPNQRNRHYSAI